MPSFNVYFPVSPTGENLAAEARADLAEVAAELGMKTKFGSGDNAALITAIAAGDVVVVKINNNEEMFYAAHEIRGLIKFTGDVFDRLANDIEDSLIRKEKNDG